MDRRQFLGCGGSLLARAFFASSPKETCKPKVRAITAFIKLERSRYQEQIQETLRVLRLAKQIVEGAAYEVQSLRITTQPFPQYVQGLKREQTLQFFRQYDELAAKESFNPNIGPAMIHDADEDLQAELLGEILSTNKTLVSSLVVADYQGIHWKSVQAAAKMVKFVEEHSPGSMGNFHFAATAMVEPYAPFYPAAYHLLGPGRRFAIATESANIVDQVFERTSGNAPLATHQLTQALSEHAIALEKLAWQIERETGWAYMGLDPTPAPLREVSIGAAIEKFTGEKFGSSGTMTAAAVITKAVQSVPVKQVGYAGLMVPVLEDNLLAQRWSERAYGIDALLAYSAVCGTGLDAIPLAGDVSQQQIERILGDVATLAFKWKKPLSARLLPIKGKKVGEWTEFDDPFLVNALIQPVS